MNILFREICAVIVTIFFLSQVAIAKQEVSRIKDRSLLATLSCKNTQTANLTLSLKIENTTEKPINYQYPFFLGTNKMSLPFLAVVETQAYLDIENGITNLIDDAKKAKFIGSTCNHCEVYSHFMKLNSGEEHTYNIDIASNYILKPDVEYQVALSLTYLEIDNLQPQELFEPLFSNDRVSVTNQKCSKLSYD